MLSFDIEKNEYLCPLCESLCNTALPLLPTYACRIQMSGQPEFSCASLMEHLTSDYWLRSLDVTLKMKVCIFFDSERNIFEEVFFKI